MRCEEVFETLYKRAPAAVAFCPYRICPLGAHVDHNLGKVTGFAIDKGLYLAYAPEQGGEIELASLRFETPVRWRIDAVPKEKANDWADYLRGAVAALKKRRPLTVGLCGVIEGTMPIGGLSSSAAVTIAFLTALCKVNGLTLSPAELIATAVEAERNYVGVAVGKLDQSCEVYSQKGRLLYLDTLDDSFALIPAPQTMKPWEVMIFFSGVERTLAGSKYNMRADEAKSAAYALKAYAGMDYGRFEETVLRDVPAEVFRQYGDRLPEPWRKRAAHWYAECARVEAGVEAWRRGDIEAFGRLSFESGKSSICQWETGSPELKTLYEIMARTDGVYGGRFSGAGFRGCCMALVDPAFEEAIREQVSAAYKKEFPALKERFAVHVCQTADGVELL